VHVLYNLLVTLFVWVTCNLLIRSVVAWQWRSRRIYFTANCADGTSSNLSQSFELHTQHASVQVIPDHTESRAIFSLKI